DLGNKVVIATSLAKRAVQSGDILRHFSNLECLDTMPINLDQGGDDYRHRLDDPEIKKVMDRAEDLGAEGVFFLSHCETAETIPASISPSWNEKLAEYGGKYDAGGIFKTGEGVIVDLRDDSPSTIF
ncbi:MAG: hypothetical protein LBQ11_01760, partial [Candidatus Nomurabacteria bacterium]|nr:hypothetical protein [Candidatus Nomurabacteria bacterium]